MAIDVQINGGAKWNASDYSVVEDSTPLDASSSSGGYGQVTVTIPSATGDKALRDALVSLSDGAQGITQGTVVTIETDQSNTTLTANGALGIFNSTVTVQPYTGTLSGYFTYLFGLFAITSGFAIDPSITPPTRKNYLSNPSARRGQIGYTTLGTGTMGWDVGADTYFLASASAAAGNAGLNLQVLTVGVDLAPSTVYTFSAFVDGNATRAGVFANGSGVASGGAFTLNTVIGAFTRESTTFTTGTSGVVTPYVLNGDAVVSGNVIAFHDAQIELGPVATPYFDGYTAETIPFLADSWTGTPDASPSTSGPALVAYVGGAINGWTQIKAVCAAQKVECAFVADNIIVRPVRTNVAQTYRNQSKSVSLDYSQIAQNINCFYYQSAQRTLALAYPLGGMTANTDIEQVDAFETITINVPLTPQASDGTGLGASLTSIQQPTATDGVTQGYSATSVYSIIGTSGNVYPAATWNAHGGSVTVAVGADTQSINITITGPADTSDAPYRLALPTDPTNTDFYSTLRIVGTGVFYNKQLMSVFAGNSPLQTANSANTTIDNPAISTQSDAFSAVLAAGLSASGPVQTLTVTTRGINTNGDPDAYSYANIGEFDAVWDGQTVAAFNSEWVGQTVAEFNAWLLTLVSNQFANQAFGNVAGARVFDDGCWYRIQEATLTPSAGVNYTAIADNTVADWNAVWAGQTVAAWNALWVGKRLAQMTPRLLATS